MSFKDRLSTFLFGSKTDTEIQEELPAKQESVLPEEEKVPETPAGDSSALELPMDHPIRQLRDLWRGRSGRGQGQDPGQAQQEKGGGGGGGTALGAGCPPLVLHFGRQALCLDADLPAGGTGGGGDPGDDLSGPEGV